MREAPAPSLSIITICRNIARDIEDTCKSVVDQTFRDFEWIVIDGASTDGTRDVLEKYADSMTVFVSEPDSGIYNAMNKGIRLAKGKYLLFLNGGDSLAGKDTLARVFSRALEADVCYGNIYFLDSARNTVTLHEAFPSERLSVARFTFRTIQHQAAFIRRDLFARFGLYDETFRIAADWEKWIVFFKGGCSFRNIGETVAIFRSGGVSDVMTKAHIAERRRVIARHYTADELAEANKLRRAEKYAIRSFGRCGAFCLASLKESDGMRVYSFLHVPVLKVRLLRDSKVYRLFGFIPVLRAQRHLEHSFDYNLLRRCGDEE